MENKPRTGCLFIGIQGIICISKVSRTGKIKWKLSTLLSGNRDGANLWGHIWLRFFRANNAESNGKAQEI